MNALPEAVTGGLTVAGGMLAAVGFAMLLRMIWTKKLAVYFFVGFFLTTYLGVPTLGIAIAGVLYCIIRYYTLIDSPKNLMNQNEIWQWKEMTCSMTKKNSILYLNPEDKR